MLGPTPAAGVALLRSSAITPIDRAEATPLIAQSQVPGALQSSDLPAVERLTRTDSRLMTTRVVLEKPPARLNLPLTPECSTSRSP